METKIFVTLWKPKRPLSIEERANLDKYLTITYRQQDEDWDRHIDDVYKYSYVGVKRCGYYEFGNDSYGREFRDSWINGNYTYDLFCIDSKK